MQFDDAAPKGGSRSGSSGAGVGDRKARAAPKPSAQPLAGRTRRRDSSPRGREAAQPSASKKRRRVESTDSGEDTEEQVEVEDPPPPPVSEKKRPRTSAAGAGAGAGAGAVSGSKAKQAHTAHYPTSTYTAAPLSKSRGERDHKTILGDCMGAICSAEINTLENYFATELPGSTHEKILTHLCDVLNELPDQINAQCASDAVFHPEVTKAERSKLDANKNKLDFLTSSLERLQHYAASPDAFLRDAGLLAPGAGAGAPAGAKSGKKTASAKASKKVGSITLCFNYF
jgi:hypothetical protein